ncbi:tRNA (adenosine(37)-N6)-threonylcarbamoyltransferase complex ATPase subunit type 1 TsaE [Candidatus Daviesbacteria bacterium]|nr:tRNA (adenosine(37)-N6)-threonylcarbamoyltransferase complex ATPase subunit type 1 TsaE [Candidatus Daviesbacteria bacterium]
MKQYLTYSEKETKDLAKKLAKNFQGGVIGLFGELGAGKTMFTQGFAQGLGIKEKIISPTFILIRQHQIPNSNNFLFHVDLYRLEKLKDLKQLGLHDTWSNPKNIVLIEWAGKIKKILPKNTTKITIAKLEGNKRLITID